MNGKRVMTVMICFIGYIYIYIIFTIYNGISVIIHRPYCWNYRDHLLGISTWGF